VDDGVVQARADDRRAGPGGARPAARDEGLPPPAGTVDLLLLRVAELTGVPPGTAAERLRNGLLRLGGSAG
jgi:hypothetical protein